MPKDLIAAHQLPSRADAYRAVHNPSSLDQAAAARDRLAFDELLRLQLAIATSRAQHAASAAFAHDRGSGLAGRFIAGLPFRITEAQRRTIAEITADMAAPSPANRLIQGDVGSGKTVVAAAALLNSVDNGHQAAMIAPTEILAAQHHAELARSLAGLVKADGHPVNVALLTNKVTGKARKTVLAGLADGTIDIVVGTHAVLADAVIFHQLSCVVIDEQHRFGVDQRRALRAKGHQRTPDQFYATATPVPRTAALTVFGDLDASTLDELPPGRSPIRTIHLPATDLAKPSAEPWVTIRNQVGQGRQAFVVTPLVAESLTREGAAAQATAADLAHGALAGLRIGVVTGKDSPADRQAIMDRFSAGELDVLVATTVIEVGVNVPNATVIAILGADRFGLAQLHQLRGRVGRGHHGGTCYLICEPKTSAAVDRMQAMVETTDGFVLAERDLATRGAGSMSGASQHGADRRLKIATVLGDLKLLEWAKADAQQLVAGDPHLGRWPGLRAELAVAVGTEGAEWLISA